MSGAADHSYQLKCFMERAFALAARASNRVYPNPKVGALLVRNDKIVGEGFHAVAGSGNTADIHPRQSNRYSHLHAARPAQRDLRIERSPHAPDFLSTLLFPQSSAFG